MSIAEPTLRRWTVEEYHRVADAVVFAPGERLELIDGEIYWMSPQKRPHLVATGLTRASEDIVSPLADPSASVTVRDLLP